MFFCPPLFKSDLLFFSAALRVTRATSEKGNIIAEIIHRSIILIYAVAGRVWEIPMKLGKDGQISNNEHKLVLANKYLQSC